MSLHHGRCSFRGSEGTLDLACDLTLESAQNPESRANGWSHFDLFAFGICAVLDNGLDAVLIEVALLALSVLAY